MKNQRILPIYQPWRWLFVITLLLCFLSYRSRTAAFIIAGIALLTIILLLCFSKRYFQFSILALLSCLVSLAILHAGYTFHYKDQKLLKYENATVNMVLTVDDVLYSNKNTSTYLCDVESCNGEDVDGKITLTADSENAFLRGEKFSCDLECALPQEYSFSFPNRLYQRSQGVLLETTLIEGSEKSLAYESRPISDAIYRLRNTLSDRFDFLDHESASLLRALLLGDRGGISTAQKRDFAKIGASHILAISGLHFSIVCGLAYWILSNFFRSKRIRCISYILFSIFFCLLCGCSPSALRACGMILFATLLSLYYMEHDPLSVLSFVGILFLSIRPYYILNISFLLSYSAAFGIIYFLPEKEYKGFPIKGKEEEKPKASLFHLIGSIGRKLFYLTMPCFAAFLFTLPFTAFFFQKISLLSILSSIVLVPLCTVCIYSGILSLLLPSFFTQFPIVAKVLCAPFRLFLYLVERFADYDNITVFLKSSAIRHGIFLFCIVLCVFLLFFSKFKKTLLVLLLLISCVSFSVHQLNFRENENAQISVYTLFDAYVFFLQVNGHHTLIVNETATHTLLKSATDDYTNRFETDHIDDLILISYSLDTVVNLEIFSKEYYIDTCYYPIPNDTVTAHLLENAFSSFGATLVTYQRKFCDDRLSFTNLNGSAFVCSFDGHQIGYFKNACKDTPSNLDLLTEAWKYPQSLFFFERDALPSRNDASAHLLTPSESLKLEKYQFPIR